MYVIGPIEPAASNRHHFILVAIDYFTKWVEASTYKVVTKNVVADFVRNNIACILGYQSLIIIENAVNLNIDLMREICKKFRIIHCNSTTYRLQMNGAVEAANKNIKRILLIIVDSNRQWHKKLPFTLLGYQTTMRTSTGAMPCMLVNGTEAVIPAKVEILSLRVIQEAKLENAEWIWIKQEQLVLIDKRKMDAVCHIQLYQNRMANAFNKRLKPRQFMPGQLVLKKIFPHEEKAKGKCAPNWHGPYVVHRALSRGALILVEMDGKAYKLRRNQEILCLKINRVRVYDVIELRST
ncbi:uncharacterized protein [Nicotiana tomentosiformis]|uniref:uncharacterized protein n=1 Tax=Nicotiana tomentosiformis TaxID=4098 RepID=UPI00051C872A|nr:uncharacterized protein LOC104086986 [Nicotiana tomentosiformis]